MAVRFGNITLQHGLMLAPMAGVTDGTFRAICRKFGAEYVVSEMISAKAMSFHDKKTAALAVLTLAEQPAGIQIFGHEPQIMAQAAHTLCKGVLSGCMPAAIDINMGCPVKKIVNNGDGSALMCHPTLAKEILSAVRRVTDLPLSVKFRTGFTKDQTDQCVVLARIAVECGVDMICVHGRTRQQMYAPPVDLDSIARVRDAVPPNIAVFGNGDIQSGADALKMMRYTGCDGVAIGRGACGNPWIFSEIAAAIDGVPYTPPTQQERIATALDHLERLRESKGERVAHLEARKHLAWYIKGFEGAVQVRREINRAQSTQQLEVLLRTML